MRERLLALANECDKIEETEGFPTSVIAVKIRAALGAALANPPQDARGDGRESGRVSLRASGPVAGALPRHGLGQRSQPSTPTPEDHSLAPPPDTGVRSDYEFDAGQDERTIIELRAALERFLVAGGCGGSCGGSKDECPWVNARRVLGMEAEPGTDYLKEGIMVYGRHHWRCGVYFQRQESEEGTVEITLPVDQPDTNNPVTVLSIPAAEWASIVAAVSAKGENADTYRRAVELHGMEAEG